MLHGQRAFGLLQRDVAWRPLDRWIAHVPDLSLELGLLDLVLVIELFDQGLGAHFDELPLLRVPPLQLPLVLLAS